MRSILFVLLTATPALAATDQAGFLLRDLSGQTQALEAHRGKIVVLNFWATWCRPCLQEMPMLVSVQSRYAARGIQVIGASADDENTQAQIPAFVKQLKLNFPVWIGATTDEMEKLGLGSALPATAVIDREGRIVGRILGMLEKRDLERRIEWLLGERKGAAPPDIVNNIEKQARAQGDKHDHDHGHEHSGEERHSHGNPVMEGASSVPS